MNQLFQYCKFVLFALLFCLFLIASACEKAPVKPVEITTNDICFYCKSPIAEKDMASAVEFITKSGFVRKFDDIACLISDAQKVGKKNIEAFYVKDIVSQKWLPADQLQYVRSDKIKTPRNGGIIAFQDAARAQQVATRYQAELVKFGDLVK